MSPNCTERLLPVQSVCATVKNNMEIELSFQQFSWNPVREDSSVPDVFHLTWFRSWPQQQRSFGVPLLAKLKYTCCAVSRVDVISVLVGVYKRTLLSYPKWLALLSTSLIRWTSSVPVLLILWTSFPRAGSLFMNFKCSCAASHPMNFVAVLLLSTEVSGWNRPTWSSPPYQGLTDELMDITDRSFHVSRLLCHFTFSHIHITSCLTSISSCLVCFARRCLPCNLFDMLCVLNFVCILCLRWFVFWIFVPYFLSAFADRLSVLLHQVVSVVAEKSSSEFSTFSAVAELLFGGFRTFRFSVWPTEFLFHRWLFAILLFFTFGSIVSPCLLSGLISRFCETSPFESSVVIHAEIL